MTVHMFRALFPQLRKVWYYKALCPRYTLFANTCPVLFIFMSAPPSLSRMSSQQSTVEESVTLGSYWTTCNQLGFFVGLTWFSITNLPESSQFAGRIFLLKKEKKWTEYIMNFHKLWTLCIVSISNHKLFPELLWTTSRIKKNFCFLWTFCFSDRLYLKYELVRQRFYH